MGQGLWGWLALVLSWSLVNCQPSTLEFPKPFVSRHWPSPFVVGMPRSGAKVSNHLSISAVLPPGFPGGPAVVNPVSPPRLPKKKVACRFIDAEGYVITNSAVSEKIVL
jgi:hypothetical protein